MNNIPPFPQNRGDIMYIKFEIRQIVSPSEDVKFSNVRGLYLRKYGTLLMLSDMGLKWHKLFLKLNRLFLKAYAVFRHAVSVSVYKVQKYRLIVFTLESFGNTTVSETVLFWRLGCDKYSKQETINFSFFMLIHKLNYCRKLICNK